MPAIDPGFTLETHGDIVEISHRGPFDVARVKVTLAALTEVHARLGRAFLLADSGGEPVTPEARQVVTEWFKESSVRLEVASWNASLFQRATGEMLSRAINFFHPGRFVLTFVRTREEALAWIDERRTRP